MLVIDCVSFKVYNSCMYVSFNIVRLWGMSSKLWSLGVCRYEYVSFKNSLGVSLIRGIGEMGGQLVGD